MDHPLFRRYALAGERALSDGTRVQMPYHIYDGRILLIGGTIDAAAANAMLSRETVKPIRTTSGRVLAGVWVCDFREAHLGAHRELQFSIYVARRELPPVQEHPLVLLKLLAFDPDVRQFCARIWNNTDVVVRYNTELLGLQAQHANAHIDGGNFVFSSAAGEIVRGTIEVPARQPMNIMPAMMRLFGMGGMMKLQVMDTLSLQVMNPISEAFPYNGEAQAYTAYDRAIVRGISSADSITFGDADLRGLNFTPTFVEHIDGCKFVYLNIHN